jgi:hypothetical protein
LYQSASLSLSGWYQKAVTYASGDYGTSKGEQMITEQMTHDEYIEELRIKHLLGEVSIDMDDPRTTAGLTAEEIKYIRGE